MSISSALSNAYSGLSVTSRAAETVSNNVSNALTEGYSRQVVDTQAVVLAGNGAGVRSDGVTRAEDVVMTSARRRAEAAMANSTDISSAMTRLADALGEPGDEGALASRITEFENSIATAQSAPDSVALQQSVLTSAKNLANSFAQISQETIRVRVDADATIAREVETVNSSLKQIEELNAEIRIFSLSGRSVAALEDQRQMLVDKVNSIIPIRQSKVNDGEIAIYTTGGEILLNGSARELGFTNTGMMTPDMTLDSGALSGLTVNGKLVTIGEDGGSLEGGSLAANFKVRDTLAPELHQQIDALARDLVERFQDTTVDPTLGAGDAGLFTDDGAAFTTADEVGLAGRLTVNALVDPSVGGELWRIRDGLGATAQGYSGDATLLTSLSDALTAIRPETSNMGLSASMSSAGFAEEITSLWASDSANQQDDLAYKVGQYDTLRAEELNATGVDTDREMQDLLVIEQAYAANARVISVIDELMNTLLEI